MFRFSLECALESKTGSRPIPNVWCDKVYLSILSMHGYSIPSIIVFHFNFGIFEKFIS